MPRAGSGGAILTAPRQDFAVGFTLPAHLKDTLYSPRDTLTSAFAEIDASFIRSCKGVKPPGTTFDPSNMAAREIDAAVSAMSSEDIETVLAGMKLEAR